jgi:hypothetical protein
MAAGSNGISGFNGTRPTHQPNKGGNGLNALQRPNRLQLDYLILNHTIRGGGGDDGRCCSTVGQFLDIPLAGIVKPQYQPIPPWFLVISDYLEPGLPKSLCDHPHYHQRLS